MPSFMCQSNAKRIEKNTSTCIHLRLILDFDSFTSRKNKSEITNKLIKPTQLEKALKAIRDGHTIAYKACKLYSVNT